MKFSEAMLKGYKAVDGRQCRDALARDVRGRNLVSLGEGSPHSFCAQGAALYGRTGQFRGWGAPGAGKIADQIQRFEEEWGVATVYINNEGMPWEHIYGMAKAAGL